MQRDMQKDLVKKNSQKIMDVWLRVGFLKREFQVVKSSTPREGDMRSRLLERSILWFILLLSIALRVSFYKIQSDDYTTFLHPWYDYIQDHGGFAALKDTFSDYNPAYLYLLAWATYIPIPAIVAIKMISTFFDILLALFTYLTLRLKYPHSSVPSIGAVVILFTPTIFLNSAIWGQCDAIYTTWCLGSLYFLLSKRPAWACLFFGIAISFKLQAIFFLPVLVVLLLTRKLPITSLILIPVSYLALLVPALLVGHDAWSLLTIYLGEAKEYSGALTLGAPTFYQWLPAQAVRDWVWMGTILATMMVTLISFLTVRSRKPITADLILKLTLVFAFAIPFFLPEMHERYFYLADVISLVYAFYFPRYFYVAVIEQLCSLFSCIPYLFHTSEIFNLAYIAFAVLFLIVITLVDLVKTLYPAIHLAGAIPAPSSDDLSSDNLSLKEEQMETENKRVTRYLQGALLVFCVGGLYYGATWRVLTGDVSRYQCYAVAFWRGWSGFEELPPGQCGFLTAPQEGQSVISQQRLLQALQQWKLSPRLVQFVATQRTEQPYHTLPSEYPLLVLLPLSLGLIVPGQSYTHAFALAMVLLAGCLYVVLRRWRSRRAALACLLYLVVAACSTAAARFDLFPSALTLFALICAVQKRWNWAFALLALAVLTKVYPVMLLAPFLLTLQQEIQGSWYAWRRWQPMVVFVGVCIPVVALSLLLNVVGTLAPLGYFLNRPIEIESLPASLLWIASSLSKTSLTYVYSFESNNIVSPASSNVTLLMTVLLLVGLLSTWWLQWRGRLDLTLSSLLTVLIVMITAKVLSAQYIIWVIPLIAYVGQSHPRWLLFWILIGLLTSWMFPFHGIIDVSFMASHIPSWDLITAVRNFLLLGFILTVLISRSFFYRRQSVASGVGTSTAGSMQTENGYKEPK